MAKPCIITIGNVYILQELTTTGANAIMNKNKVKIVEEEKSIPPFCREFVVGENEQKAICNIHFLA